MRSFRSTLIFAIVVFIVVIWSILDYKGKERSKERQEVRDQIFGRFVKENVDQMDFRGLKPFSLEKIKDKWYLIQPFKDLASKNEVENSIEKILKKKQKILLHDHNIENDIVWADYGLENPKLTLSVTSSPLDFKKKNIRQSGSKEKQTIKVLVSSTQSYDGKNFLRINDKNELSIAEENWDDVVSLEAENFREKSLFDEDLVSIESFVFQKGKNKLEFKKEKEKEKDHWKYVKNLDLVIDSSYVKNFIKKVRKLKGEHFLSEVTTEELEKKYRLKEPEFQVIFNGNKKKPFDLSLSLGEREDLKSLKGKEEGKLDAHNEEKSHSYQWTLKLSALKASAIYAQVSHRDFIGKIRENDVKDFPKKLSDFRDRGYPFSFNPEEVFEFDLRFEKKKLKLIQKEVKEAKELKGAEGGDLGAENKKAEKKGEQLKEQKNEHTWVIDGGEESQSVSVDQLDSFLRQISKLKLDEFLGLRPRSLSSKNHLVLKDKAGKILLDLNWDKSFSKKNEEGKKETYYFVKTNKLTETVSLKKHSLDEILDIRLTKQKVGEKQKKNSNKDHKKSLKVQ